LRCGWFLAGRVSVRFSGGRKMQASERTSNNRWSGP
jgi:hypothetical protein